MSAAVSRTLNALGREGWEMAGVECFYADVSGRHEPSARPEGWTVYWLKRLVED